MILVLWDFYCSPKFPFYHENLFKYNVKLVSVGQIIRKSISFFGIFTSLLSLLCFSNFIRKSSLDPIKQTLNPNRRLEKSFLTKTTDENRLFVLRAIFFNQHGKC